MSQACEERLSTGLASIESECFWESGLGALESGHTSVVDGQAREEDEDQWEEEVVKTLQELAHVSVVEGYAKS